MKRSIPPDDEVPGEAAEGVVAPGGGQILNGKEIPRLTADLLHQLVQGEPVLIGGKPGDSAEVAHRLEMNPPYRRRMGQGEAQDIADGADVHLRYKGGDKGHADAVLGAPVDGLFFDVEEGAPPEGAVDLVVSPVELQKDEREPRLCEGLDIGFVRSQPEPVCVELHVPASEILRRPDDPGKVVPHGGFSPAELHERFAGTDYFF